MSDITINTKGLHMTPPPTLTESEVDRLLYALKHDHRPGYGGYRNARDYLIGCLMADAGLRVSEVVSLKHPQVLIDDQPSNTLHIPAIDSKNNKSRTIPLTERVQQAITNYTQHTSINFGPDKFQWLFPTNDYKNHLTTRQVHRIINSMACLILHRPVNPHLLRHTFATRIVRASNTAVAQQLLGHKALSSTQVYVHPNADDCSNAINSLNKNPGA